MYSTPKKRLFELKKELKQLKRRMDKRLKIAGKKGERPHSYGLEYEDNSWNTYEIITSDGKMYTMDCTTIYFPDIDFRKIVYVNKTFSTCYWRSKKTGKSCNNKAWFDAYDSVTGYYKGKHDWEYSNNIRNKFHVTETLYTGLD